uniref:Uncharacterized protein n=1 Tax=Arion vulgaris TaxID=1028688 RepID=A0A0B6ZQW4_9EUPU
MRIQRYNWERNIKKMTDSICHSAPPGQGTEFVGNSLQATFDMIMLGTISTLFSLGTPG